METVPRQTYLDWLRIFSILGVLLFHSAMPYVAEDSWHIKNAQTSNLLMESNYFMHLVRMPLLFFISGTVSYYMMQKRSSWNFIGLRARRLLIPLLFGMLVIVPPQIYIERITQGFHGNFWQFYPSIFNFVPYPKGNFSWHHLWFIAYLFVYDLVFAPVFAWIVSPKSAGLKAALHKLSRGKLIYLLMLPAIIWYGLLSAKYGETNDLAHDGCYLIYWLCFLLVGFICVVQPALMDSLERNRRFGLTIGFLAILLLNYIRWNKLEPWADNVNPPAIMAFGYLALKALVGWTWVLSLVGYGKRYLNRPHRSLNYINQAVYPFYILHQTVIVVISWYIVQVQNESILNKYLYTVGITFFITMGVFHLLIKPFPVTRFLFGLKPLASKIKPVSEEKNGSETNIVLSAV